VLLFALVPGITLILGSVVLGIHDFPAQAPAFAAKTRQVGYLFALNWSLNYGILFPLALYLMVHALQGMADALGQLHDRGMVRDRSMRVVSGNMIAKLWAKGTPTLAWLLLIFAVALPGIFSIGEWIWNNLLRLLGGGPAASFRDYDWGLAAIMHAPGADARLPVFANAAFDLLAFACEGALIAATFAFFLTLLDVDRALPGTRGRLRVVPDLKSEDPRRGFEVFAEPLNEMLGVAFINYLMCYFVRLQGVYMEDTAAPSLAAFVHADIFAGAKAADGQTKISAVAEHIFAVGEQTTRGTLAELLFVLVFTFSLVVVVMTVRKAAYRARAAAVQFLNDAPGRTLFGLEPQVELDRAKSIVAWPLGYLRLDVLLFLTLFALFTLVLYRVGLFVAGAVLAALLIRAMNRIRKWSQQ